MTAAAGPAAHRWHGDQPSAAAALPSLALQVGKVIGGYVFAANMFSFVLVVSAGQGARRSTLPAGAQLLQVHVSACRAASAGGSPLARSPHVRPAALLPPRVVCS